MMGNTSSAAMDEFVLKVLMNYEGKNFQNASAENVNLDITLGNAHMAIYYGLLFLTYSQKYPHL